MSNTDNPRYVIRAHYKGEVGYLAIRTGLDYKRRAEFVFEVVDADKYTDQARAERNAAWAVEHADIDRAEVVPA